MDSCAGGYGEDRGVYSQVLFAPEGVEPRTVHLGFDIFALAGAGGTASALTGWAGSFTTFGSGRVSGAASSAPALPRIWIRLYCIDFAPRASRTSPPPPKW